MLLSRVNIALLVALSLFFQNAGADENINNIKKNQVITFTYLDGEFPFSYTSATKPAGMSVDLCTKVAELIRIKLKLKNLDIRWIKATPGARFQSLLEHTSDMECSSITDTPEREHSLIFSRPYFYASTAFMTHKKDHIQSLKDLYGHTVFITSGDIAIQELSSLNAKMNYSILTHLSQSALSGFQNMEATENSVFVADDVILYSLMKKYSSDEEYNIPAERMDKIQPYALVMNNNALDLRELVNDSLTELFRSGDFENIYSKWFLTNILPENILINFKMPDKLKADLVNSKKNKV